MSGTEFTNKSKMEFGRDGCRFLLRMLETGQISEPVDHQIGYPTG